MRILITGAGGFVGSHLVARLSNQHEIYALARHPIISPAAHWIQHDLTQPLEDAGLPDQIDALIHLAQSRHYREFPEHAADIFKVNIASTFALLEYARRAGAQHFIFASSGGVYGSRDDSFVETDRVTLRDFYLTSKYTAELMIEKYHPFFHTLVCRLFFVYGKKQNPNMLVPRLVQSVIRGQPVSLQGQDGIRINPIYVGDVVEAFVHALDLEGRHIANIAGPQILSLREIANVIGECVGRKSVFDIHSDDKPNHLTGEISRMKSLLCEPTTEFANGVIEVCQEVLARERS